MNRERFKRRASDRRGSSVTALRGAVRIANTIGHYDVHAAHERRWATADDAGAVAKWRASGIGLDDASPTTRRTIAARPLLTECRAGVDTAVLTSIDVDVLRCTCVIGPTRVRPGVGDCCVGDRAVSASVLLYVIATTTRAQNERRQKQESIYGLHSCTPTHVSWQQTNGHGHPPMRPAQMHVIPASFTCLQYPPQ